MVRDKRVTGEERRELAVEVARLYTDENMTIMAIADKLDMSYGKTYALLSEAGVPRRRRGRQLPTMETERDDDEE